jgi:hypothetical protein
MAAISAARSAACAVHAISKTAMAIAETRRARVLIDSGISSFPSSKVFAALLDSRD